MWPFDTKSDNVAEQVEIYDEIIEAKTEQLRQLDGIDNPNAALQREKLTEEIRQAKLQRAQTIESAERAGHDIKTYERDRGFFGE